ncbi:MAG: SIMPL domain-containing protein [Cytobacillus gottheilii]|uniref:SIMPL domain-containing protein n=1 Tax=Cytobacillus gottheilii TaxID=859144 RepID=UPI00082E9BDD|nr:SIMPL domain-containing protein [Cytobacillus gottheilii]
MVYGQSFYRETGHSASKKRITVVGVGEWKIQPTEAQIQLGVREEQKTLNEAQAISTSTMTRIIQGLKEQGIPEEQIQTASYQVFPVYDYDEGTQVLRGYQVEHLLQITVKELEKTGEIVDTAVQNGANIVNSIQFTSSLPNAYKQQALSIAVFNAVEKAEAIARSMGVQLNQTPLRVSEQLQTDGIAPFSSTALMAKAEAVPIQPGEITINSRIIAEFSYYS